MDLLESNYLNIAYKRKLHSFKITNFDIVSIKTFLLDHVGVGVGLELHTISHEKFYF